MGRSQVPSVGSLRRTKDNTLMTDRPSRDPLPLGDLRERSGAPVRDCAGVPPVVRDLCVDDLVLDNLAGVLAVRMHGMHTTLARGAERSSRVLIFDGVVVGVFHHSL